VNYQIQRALYHYPAEITLHPPWQVATSHPDRITPHCPGQIARYPKVHVADQIPVVPNAFRQIAAPTGFAFEPSLPGVDLALILLGVDLALILLGVDLALILLGVDLALILLGVDLAAILLGVDLAAS
jgi:hypothetical protein